MSAPEAPTARVGATRGRSTGPANKPGLDYRLEAASFLRFDLPIVDAHCHVVGPMAAALYQQVARLYGVGLSYSMTPLPYVEPVRDVLRDSVRFIAVPTWGDPDKARAWREGLLENIEIFRARYASPIMKIWNSPALRERFPGESGADLVELDSPWRVKACELAQSLGMMFMVHVADPDTWFSTKYTDVSLYKVKRDQYAPLERMLDRFTVPWIAAHMGGWPEDLDFLEGLLSRHHNLHLDTSATKWQVRELSKHPRRRVVEFFTRWRGRILFGSDIVTSDDHVTPRKENPQHPKADQANSPEAAFDLYASRYWAMRALLETEYDGPSPIADADLKMVDPARSENDSPHLRGLALPRDVLESLYFGTAASVLDEWIRAHPA